MLYNTQVEIFSQYKVTIKNIQPVQGGNKTGMNSDTIAYKFIDNTTLSTVECDHDKFTEQMEHDHDGTTIGNIAYSGT